MKQRKATVFFWLFGALILVHGVPAVGYAQSDCEGRPSWVTRPPSSDLYYTGIGFASKRPSVSIKDIQEAAYQDALNDIATSIHASVDVTDDRTLVDDGGQVSDSFSSRTVVNTQIMIQGAETVEAWDCSQEYAIYLRYAKQAHQDDLEAARTAALASLQKANAVREQGDPVGALQHVFSAWGRFAPYAYALESVRDEAASLLTETLRQIELKPERASVEAKTGMPLPEPIRVKAIVRNTDRGIQDLPIRFAFQKGEGDLDAIDWSSEQGTATSYVRRINDNEKIQTILAVLDVGQIVDKTALETGIKEAVLNAAKPFPQALISLSVSNPGIFVELGEGDEFCAQHMVRDLKDMLAQKGDKVFVEKKEDADLSLVCVAEMIGESSSPILNGQTVYEYEGSVHLVDLHSSEQYCSTTHASKQTGSSATGGASRAFVKIRSKFEETLPECMEMMLQAQ